VALVSFFTSLSALLLGYWRNSKRQAKRHIDFKKAYG